EVGVFGIDRERAWHERHVVEAVGVTEPTPSATRMVEAGSEMLGQAISQTCSHLLLRCSMGDGQPGRLRCATAAPGQRRPSWSSRWVAAESYLNRNPGGRSPRGGSQGGRQPYPGCTASSGGEFSSARASLFDRRDRPSRWMLLITVRTLR